MQNVRALVCGGRDYADAVRVKEVLDEVHAVLNIVAVIHGAARGADSLAGAWARGAGVAEVACPADWETFGRSAGVRRNQAMLDDEKPDLVIAFPGGRGTADMMRRATAHGVEVIDVAAIRVRPGSV